MCVLLVVVVAFVCFELCCVMLCAPALSLALFFFSFSFFFLKCVAVCFLLSCATKMFLVPLFGVCVVFSGYVMFCCKRMYI